MATTTSATNQLGGTTTKQSLSAAETGGIIAPYRLPVTVTAVPGSGGSMLVQYTTSAWADVCAETATWLSWPAGTVYATTTDTIVGPITAIRATATTQPGVLEVVQ